MDASRSIYDHLLNRISTRAAQVGVIGLGYVGLPLAVAIARAGFPVSGFDIEAQKVESLNNGHSYIEAVTSAALAGQVASGRFRATADFAELADCDVIIICVPTPLTKNREPDLSFVKNTAGTIAKHLRLGQLVVLESTTYPGTTDDVIKPILEQTGLQSNIDFFLGFSPEREDPGNRSFEVATIPKVVAGDGIEAAALVQAFYQGVVKTVVPVSTTATAEAVKLTENIFRSVNIALVNELKVVLGAMGIDIWEVIEAAKSKPFGYMPFYPGPGLGGHCVPIDPFYLTWKAREYELPTRFIELAAEINTAMPRHVVDELAKALDRRCGKALSRSRILIIGLAYKKNVPDIRESPSLRLIELIEEWGGKAEFHDPHVTEVPSTREHMAIKGRRSVELSEAALKDFDAVVVATDHDAIDYQKIADHALLIVDTRNVFGRLGLVRETVVKA
ncbi:nucleotide sugar dehydrogenase [Mesorhizobium sp.]|uniref:nucleotide sugar dehydrogenase n=1 Tax=Mesorhizobium sp. TaxID=1871066 RepID=UPI000FE74B5C|nr:nucleotide sugar dehydrogenase [Mesorhizobium sp.]RWM25043.1 MAG: nucleotide sugar dehydrogenase [Mesorhizobium sp.]RWM33501.1 MAG: nucleotide sugar dehydrogenase [Mesorhizobium sp.]TIO73640.1 MAG: nucleotide sugar dehydrogenase [Mesorhizobium sp.]TIO81707.1 MAG: nucleotide sugar dehydrogenase [Mesorhizobium sp.]TJV48534.1 MAG: nucleotide sugar dehydrogenase [Mesorhizobium sp.]